jgi:hypothetical protein
LESDIGMNPKKMQPTFCFATGYPHNLW